MIPVLRDAGLSELFEGDSVETVATGLVFTEGPLWLPDGSLLFQDVKAENSYQVTPDGTLHLLRENTGAANGQTFDAEGRIIFCEQTGRRISRMNPDGSNIETVTETWQGARLNSPNDIHRACNEKFPEDRICSLKLEQLDAVDIFNDDSPI